MKRGHDARARLASGAAAALLLAGCGSPTIVNTGEPWTPAETSVPAPRLPPYRSNAQLANAADFHAGTGLAYHFASPSGRWHCVIVPHDWAGCRAVSAARLPITGVPTAVPGPDGPATPDTILIDQTSEVRFAVTDGVPESPIPIATLPFGAVLAVAGFRCNVQEASGVSCGSEASGKGFTFSADGYTRVYTDVPG